MNNIVYKLNNEMIIKQVIDKLKKYINSYKIKFKASKFQIFIVKIQKDPNKLLLKRQL